MKRWLWGPQVVAMIVGMALVATFGRGEAKVAVGASLLAAATGTQVHIPPFAAPATMPALGEELARGLYAALRDANIPARLGKGDDGSAIVGRLEELSQAQVRLHASYHGHSVQSVGDLEHLDDLVYAVFTQLRPRLQAADSRSGALTLPAVSPAVSSDATPTALAVAAPALPPPPAVGPSVPPAAAASAAKSSTKTADKDAAVRLASLKEVTSPARPTASSHRPVESRPTPPLATTPVPPTVKELKDPKEPKESVVASAPSLPAPPIVTSEPIPEALPHLPSNPPPPGKNPGIPRPPLAPYTFDTRRPRVAVHVVGDPVARIPPGYVGLGAVGQQSLISYLQQRLRLPAVASRLVGLTGGLVALDQSLRVGARHTLMVRLDNLVLSASPSAGTMPGQMPGPFAGGTLSGRIHTVLLVDGKLLLDRSVMLPPTLVLPSDTPAQAYSRSIIAAMDAISSELASRLAEPLPNPPSSMNQLSTLPGPPRSP